MTMLVLKAQAAVRHGDVKMGAYNRFVKVTERLGIKYNFSKEDRDALWYNQREAAKHGLGPEVYERIDFKNSFGVPLYGYFTEVVQVYDYEDYCEDFITIMREQMSELCEQLDAIGFRFLDNHRGNVGVKNGKLICIDFDGISIKEGYNFLPI